jgi:aspartyl-tRNA(Asn)/glutamyl-tRNA(Gln) amidotransferase subunit C
MALTHEDVKQIATLARLRFTPEEEVRLTGQLAKIVDYIDQLQAFEIADADPGSRGVQEADDKTAPCLPREKLLANAPASLDGFLLVPEVKGANGGSGDA